ncbi:unnamed protein product [Fraxinus pennsylvanica]|uniref:Uncharacterized protein n=1 Tax=Fraxinus pennsylvanica TaxID=56036 RepID=A0AAD2DKK0_9LAMI|nr:unnamed protein product [Fraxinus pennsylvanica]
MYFSSLKYGKTWRAREHALEVVMDNPDQSYRKLPMFTNEFMEKNPRSKTGIEVDTSGHFRYAFMALRACIQGWTNVVKCMSSALFNPLTTSFEFLLDFETGTWLPLSWCLHSFFRLSSSIR